MTISEYMFDIASWRNVTVPSYHMSCVGLLTKVITDFWRTITMKHGHWHRFFANGYSPKKIYISKEMLSGYIPASFDIYMLKAQ